MRCETIKVVSGDGFKIINLDDFDSKKDKEWKEKVTRKTTVKKDK